MSEVKDPAIKLFGRTISLPLIPNDSSSSAAAPPAAPTSPPCEVSSASQHETEEPSRKELTSEQDNDSSHQTTTSSSIFENPKTPSAERETSQLKSSTNGEQSEASVSQDKAPKKPDKILPCPRCNSMDTKFCYYNNYNVNQPRHFCKNCQRYWTAGGTMRNVPVGAGRRKNKNSTASQYRHIMIPEALQGPASNGLHSAVLALGPDSPLCNSMSSVLSIADQPKAPKPSTYVSYGSRDDDGNYHSIGVVSGTTCSASRESISDKRIEGGFPPPQLAYLPSSPPWPYPWNSAVPHAFCPPGYPVSFYTTPPPSYWGCVGPSWNVPCVSPQSSVNHALPGPNSPLGKHSRDGSITTTTHKENPNNTEQSYVLIPKTLRIDDPSEAAKSSIWSTLGIRNDKANSLNGGGGLFKPFPSSKGIDKTHAAAVEASPVLHANPAALSRSLTFHEQT